ncbi:S-adenosylmethionine transporter [Lambiella insularis]|nr:S-adenosylmethionine transporter [Lambiella insularis]
MSAPTKGQSPFTQALLAGALAGTTVDLSLYPVDTLKTRLQSSAGFASAGGFRGIYAGVGSALVGSAPSAALFFVTYEATKTWFYARRERTGRGGSARAGGNAWTEPFEHMAAATLGEVAACAVRVPTEVVKQRAQAVQYASSRAALRAILARRRTVGVGGVWREMYRGWGVTVMREVPFTVIQFPLWEGMKEWRRRTTGKEGVGAVESGLFGSVAGAVAAGVTTPLDVLKTRMMLAREKMGMWELAGGILRERGGRAFFAGMGPRVLWISAGGAVFLGSYQWAYNALGGTMHWEECNKSRCGMC